MGRYSISKNLPFSQLTLRRSLRPQVDNLLAKCLYPYLYFSFPPIQLYMNILTASQSWPKTSLVSEALDHCQDFLDHNCASGSHLLWGGRGGSGSGSAAPVSPRGPAACRGCSCVDQLEALDLGPDGCQVGWATPCSRHFWEATLGSRPNIHYY